LNIARLSVFRLIARNSIERIRQIAIDKTEAARGLTKTSFVGPGQTNGWVFKRSGLLSSDAVDLIFSAAKTPNWLCSSRGGEMINAL